MTLDKNTYVKEFIQKLHTGEYMIDNKANAIEYDHITYFNFIRSSDDKNVVTTFNISYLLKLLIPHSILAAASILP